jgi:hypothetical protein
MKRRSLTSAVLRILGVISAVFILGGQASAAEEPIIDLKDLGHGRYDVEGHFAVEASTRVVWEVLTDYAKIASFVSSMERSELILDTAGHKVVEQEASAKAYFFSRSVNVVLHVIEEPPKRITFEDIANQDFAYYRGTWTLSDHGSPAHIVYRLECERRFMVPNFLAKKVLKQNAQRLLEEVSREIIRRKEKGAL